MSNPAMNQPESTRRIENWADSNEDEIIDIGIPIDLSEELLQRIKNTEQQLLRLSDKGLPLIKFRPTEDDTGSSPPHTSDATDKSSPYSTCDRSSKFDKDASSSVDLSLNTALQALELEFGQGILLSPTIISNLNILGNSSHGKQLPNPSATLKAIEARSDTLKRQFALTLASSCIWGIKALLGCLIGMEVAVVGVTASQENTLLAGLSTILDNMALKEKEAQERDAAWKRSLNETTRLYNEQASTFAKFSTTAETLLLKLQDVQNNKQYSRIITMDDFE